MVCRSLGLFLVVALSSAIAQDEIPGIFGKIAARPSAGDVAPDISFTKMLSSPGSAPWTTEDLSGQVTVLFPFPYVSGNLRLVNEWNALVGSFAGKPVRFIWIAGEREDTLLPFLQEHPMKGWVLNDPGGATGRSYGLEQPQTVIIGPDRRIVGFDGDPLLSNQEVIQAVLDNRITIALPEATSAQLKAFSASGKVRLWPKAHQMPRVADHRPDFAPSYAVHISPARKQGDGGDYAGPDYWNLQGLTVRQLLAEMSEVNPIRIGLPASVDTGTRYDFAIVLPKAEDRDSMRGLIRQGAEDYFHIVGTSENRLRDVYLVTASDKKPPASTFDPQSGGGGYTSSSYVGFTQRGGRNGSPIEKAHAIDEVTDMGVAGATVDEFCDLLEKFLDRPVVNETGLAGRFDLEVSVPKRSRGESPKRDFVERLRNQLGLVITAAQRNVETIEYRLR